MKGVIKKYNLHVNKDYAKQVVLAIAFLLISLVINYYSSLYATEVASSPVTDIILSNIPIFDVSFFFIYGALFLWFIFLLIIFIDPKKIAFSLKTVALFVVVRSIFVSVTHIAPFPGVIATEGVNRFFDLFSGFSGDLFFSGHTGLPFLFALILWKEKALRYIMLSLSVFFGVIVLMGHIHYTIDVLAAFFITYSIYRLAEIFFKNDREYFYNGPKQNISLKI